MALRGKGFGGLSNPVRSKDPDEKREERARREKERLAAKEEKVSGEACLGHILFGGLRGLETLWSWGRSGVALDQSPAFNWPMLIPCSRRL